eukprot:TRINITY_DN21139_c0_g2_i1.p1 TRINITY_DN21139_c0_g2~~TRINITY_DN21139_c0_g2_i1.p1  ORF type:complete len:243 (+),score=82.63 TRINITY_DN21139_c0_g2_i1:96-731(+)
MMGGWGTRVADMKKAMRSATNTCHSENELMQHMLRQQRFVLEDLVLLEDRLAELQSKGKGLADLPKDEVDSFSQKLLDIKDTMDTLGRTNQHTFNKQVEEYVRVHRKDFDEYQGKEREFLKAEQAKDEEERRDHCVIEKETNIQAIDEARSKCGEISDVFLARNRWVVRNEGFFLHSKNNVLRAVAEGEEFVERYEQARGANTGSWGWSWW